MDMDVRPDCPQCHGEGTVPWDDAHPFTRIPCGTCIQRYHDAHCPMCDGPMPAPPWRAELVVRGQVHRTTNVCSNRCAVAMRVNHGVVEVMPPAETSDA